MTRKKWYEDWKVIRKFSPKKEIEILLPNSGSDSKKIVFKKKRFEKDIDSRIIRLVELVECVLSEITEKRK